MAMATGITVPRYTATAALIGPLRNQVAGKRVSVMFAVGTSTSTTFPHLSSAAWLGRLTLPINISRQSGETETALDVLRWKLQGTMTEVVIELADRFAGAP